MRRSRLWSVRVSVAFTKSQFVILRILLIKWHTSKNFEITCQQSTEIVCEMRPFHGQSGNFKSFS